MQGLAHGDECLPSDWGVLLSTPRDDELFPITNRPYWSGRHRRSPAQGIAGASRMFEGLARQLVDQGFFAEWFGQECVDGPIVGLAGREPTAFVLRRTGHADIWPVGEQARDWDDASLFTAVEFCHDHVSKPTEAGYHSYNDCGDHYTAFDGRSGREEYRTAVNSILDIATLPFELDATGAVVHRAPPGLETMYAAGFVTVSGSDYDPTARHAIEVFRARGSSVEDRRDAVKALADVLEELRPLVEGSLRTKDEQDLYALMNRFGIRHRRAGQQTDYDGAIFLSWMFNYLLAAIHASTRLINRATDERGDVARSEVATEQREEGDRVGPTPIFGAGS